MATVVRMPEVLANTESASIQQWLVAVGDEVAVGRPLAEVETDKAVVEYAAETAGTVLRLLVEQGRSVAVGEPIAVIGVAGETVEDAPGAPSGSARSDGSPTAGGAATPSADKGLTARGSSAPSAAPEPETAPEPGTSPVAAAPTDVEPVPVAAAANGSSSGADLGRVFSSPLVRRLARDHGVEISALTGSGPGGRVVRRDLEAYLATRGSAPAAAAPAAVAAYEEVPLTSMRRTIARRLVESKTTIPNYTLTADVDVTALLRLRTELDAATGVKTSVNDWVVKAFASAYVDVPDANVTWTDTAIRRYSTVDLSVAVALPNGLITPVLRGVETLGLRAIGARVRELAERARAGSLGPADLEGGTATVSNLGMYGIHEFSAIINPPQSAIIAVGAARPQPVVRDGELTVGDVLTITMSADHRVLDGALAAQLLAALVDSLSRPLRLLG